MLKRFRKYILPLNEIIVNIPLNSNILDVGCGDNLIAQKINLKKFKSYTGFDINIKKEINSKNYRIFKSDWEKMLGQIKNYDVILIIDIMHHIKKNLQEKLIQTTLSNMKKDSILIFKDISNRNIFFSTMNWLHDFVYNFQIINYYSSKKITDILKKDKFSYQHFYKRILWYDHEFIVIRKKK